MWNQTHNILEVCLLFIEINLCISGPVQFKPVLFRVNYIWKKEKLPEKGENKFPTGNKMRLNFTSHEEQWMPEETKQ